MADVPGKFYRATKVRTGVAPSSAGSIEGEVLPPVNPPGSSLNSVGLTMPSAFTVSNSPLTSNGTIGVAGAGTVGQYIRGDGSLADFPQSSGGGSSVSYYLNGSVDQGTIGGIAYKELSKVPILGAGTDFTINADGYIASFITDAGDPSLLEIPGGNWNFETYFSASSGGGSPTFYVELYKVSSGGTATLIASSSSAPELIAFGTNLNPYFSTLAVPTTTLALTDRLAVRYYVTHSGRTITLHTENNHLCQIVTTFTTGITALNGLTAQVQNFAVGTTGTDFNIASATATHTFNLPTASATNRGALSSADWSTFNAKQNALTLTTTNTSGAATLVGATLNIPNYGSALSGYLPLTGGVMTGQIVLKEGTDSTDFSKGLRFPNDPYGGGSDISGLRLYQDGAGTEKMVLELYIGNDVTGSSQDRINFRTAVGLTPDNNLVTINDNIIWNAGNITPVPVGRTITINGTTQDLSANRTFNVGTVTSVTASSPLASSGGTTPNITIQQASGSQSGFLSSTDWTTFNNKQNALTNPVTGTGTTNTLPKFTGTSSIGNSLFSDNGTNGAFGGTNYSSGTGLRSFNISAQDYPQLAFWANNQNTASIAGLGFTGTLTLNADPTNVFVDSKIVMSTDGTERFAIFNNGNVSISNSPNDNGFKLDVSGTGRFTSNLTAASFVRSGGTSSQYLMADGSVSTLSNPVTGTGTTNYLPKFTGSTTIGNSSITDNGTEIVLNGLSRFTAGGFDTYISQSFGNTINFGYNANTYPYDGWVNYRGFQNGTTQFRNFKVGDGKENAIATFIGSTGNVGIGTLSPFANLQVLGTIKVATGNAQGILGLGEANGTTVNVGLWRGAANAPTTDGNFLNLGGFDGIVFATGNAAIGSQTPRMRITSDGNVGIGTPSPTNPLHIVSNTLSQLNIQALSGNTNAQINLEPSGTGIAIIGPANPVNLSFRTDASIKMTLTTSGRLLIGNPPPAESVYTLDVVGGARFTNTTRIDNGSLIITDTNLPQQSIFANYIPTNGNTFGLLRFGARFNSTTYGSGSHISVTAVGTWSSTNYGTNLSFGTVAQNSDVLNTRMTIFHNGNVGIGTPSPPARLSVQWDKSTAFAGSAVYDSQAFNASNHGGTLAFGGTFNSAGAYTEWSAIGGMKSNTTDGNVSGDINFYTRLNSSAMIERMKITSVGDVFIGCESDPNASTNGIGLYPNGEIDISRSSGTTCVFNRNTTNGQIVDFRYNNTQVGSISTNSNSLPSDLNFKKDIVDISIGLNLVNKLRPVHYRHKMDEDDEALSNGIIAQELEQALLDCGIEKNSLLMLQHKPNQKQGESQYWVDYTKMIPVLIKSIQELKQEIDTLKN